MKQALIRAVGMALIWGALSQPVGAGKPQFTRPPYAGAYEPQGVDERGMWMDADEGERTLRDSPAVVHDPTLNDWLRQVLCRTVGDDRCASARIYLVRDLSFNASMSPNGMMLVHTGLLVRMHTEAELASVLGHEFGHFEKRHSLAAFRSRRGATDAINWLLLAGIAANRSTTYIRRDIVYGYYRFERDEEVEADLISTVFIAGSSFRHRSAIIWYRNVLEDDRRRMARGLKPGAKHFTGWLDSHPSSLTRAAYLAAIEAEAKEDGDEGVEAYAAATAGIMPELYDGLVKSNDFGGTDYILSARGEAVGWNGPLLYARGELYRLRGNPRDLVTARDFYRTAMAFVDAPSETWRGLGLCEMRLGDTVAGRVALAEYLKRVPTAPDAAAIKMLLENQS